MCCQVAFFQGKGGDKMKAQNLEVYNSAMASRNKKRQSRQNTPGTMTHKYPLYMGLFIYRDFPYGHLGGVHPTIPSALSESEWQRPDHPHFL